MMTRLRQSAKAIPPCQSDTHIQYNTIQYNNNGNLFTKDSATGMASMAMAVPVL